MSAATLSPSRGAIVAPAVRGAPRRAFVRRTLAEWKLRHPELRGRVTVLGLLAVCAREGIWARRRALSSGYYGLAVTVPIGGPPWTRAIMLSPRLAGRRLLWVFAHELGHMALGHCDENARRFRAGLPATDDQRHELEADLFADWLIGEPLAAVMRQQPLERAA